VRTSAGLGGLRQQVGCEKKKAGAIEAYAMRTQQLLPNPPMRVHMMRRQGWDVKQGGQLPSKLDR
jgi:hypothetical protein